MFFLQLFLLLFRLCHRSWAATKQRLGSEHYAKAAVAGSSCSSLSSFTDFTQQSMFHFIGQNDFHLPCDSFLSCRFILSFARAHTNRHECVLVRAAKR